MSPRTTIRLKDMGSALWVLMRHPLTISVISISSVFWFTTLFLRADQIIQILNYVVVSVATGVLVAYIPAAVEAARRGNVRSTLLATGISLIAFAAIEVRIWSILIRIFDWEELRNSYWLAFFLVHGLVGYLLHLAPPGAPENDIPGRNWIKTGILVGVGLLIASLFIGFGYDKQLI